jgi:hypothetical protein
VKLRVTASAIEFSRLDVEVFAAQWLTDTVPDRQLVPGLAVDPRTVCGRCGMLLLDRGGLPPGAPCWFPGAPDPDAPYSATRKMLL